MEQSNVVIYVVVGLIALILLIIIATKIIRWILSVDKLLENQQKQIDLLTGLNKKLENR